MVLQKEICASTAFCLCSRRLSPVQSWAAMEESEGALQRATELRSYRMQGINDVVLPANFGISLSQEPADSPLKAVAATVRSLPSFHATGLFAPCYANEQSPTYETCAELLVAFACHI